MADIPNAFIGKVEKPTSKEVDAALGPSTAVWHLLLGRLAVELGLTEGEWNSYSPKYGWAFRLKQKKRNIVYLGPCQGCFRVSLVLGDRAMAAARAAKPSAALQKLLDAAPRYPEGSGIYFLLKSRREIPSILKLTKIKMAN